MIVTMTPAQATGYAEYVAQVAQANALATAFLRGVLAGHGITQGHVRAVTGAEITIEDAP